MRKVVKQFVKEWQKRWPLLKMEYEGGLVIDNDNVFYRLDLNFRRLGGNNYFQQIMSIDHKSIESKWSDYGDILGNKSNSTTTLFFSPYDYCPQFHDRGWGYRWDEWLQHDSEENIINGIIDEYSIPLFKKYTSIIEVDKRINATDDFSECMKLSNQGGLPFRKVLVAREAGNPRAKEIEDNMRNWCEFTYSMEGATDSDRAYLYVFEELFGKGR